MRRSFSARQLIALMDLHAVGFTDTEISERLEVTYAVVSRYRNALGLKPNPKGPLFTDGQFMELYEGGFSDVEIGVFLCAPVVVVSRRRRKLGFYAPVFRGFTEEEFMELYEQGLDDQEIADRLDSFVKTIRKQRYLLGLTVNGRRALVRRNIDNKIRQGEFTVKIAEEFQVSNAYVNQRKFQIMPWSRKVSFNRLILDDKLFRSLYEQGLGDREIAVIVGVTQASVSRRRRNLALPRHQKKIDPTKIPPRRDRVLTPIELLKLIDLYEHGHRNPYIARELKVYQNVIASSRVALGLQPYAKVRWLVNPRKKKELSRLAYPNRMIGMNEYRASLLKRAHT